jgi:hypothetical protein
LQGSRVIQIVNKVHTETIKMNKVFSNINFRSLVHHLQNSSHLKSRIKNKKCSKNSVNKSVNICKTNNKYKKGNKIWYRNNSTIISFKKNRTNISLKKIKPLQN